MERWIHVDCKQMPPTVEALLRDIAAWSSDGATGIVFEWENMFPYPGLGDAVRLDAYSPADIERILNACRQAGLSAIPLVQTFGHLEWLLSQPAYRTLREFDDYAPQIRACDAAVLTLLKKKIAALIQVHHDSPFIHLGADEAARLSRVDRPDCSSVREGACAVFLRHMRPLIEQVLASGKRPVVWADMPLRHPENIDDFPKDLVFCDWLYTQTADHAPAVHGWGIGTVSAAGYADVDPLRRRLFEPYWRLDAKRFPAVFYQFPYTPFLRDKGYDVLVAPATLFGDNALAATHLPNARANQRGWLRAARRFGAMGALNTCWAIRGALREGTRAGHRAFLLQGMLIDALPADRDISLRCWEPLAGAAAARVADCVDRLAPATGPIARTAPISFDPVRRTHRPRGYDQRWAPMRESLAAISPDDDRVEAQRAASVRGENTAAILGALDVSNDDLAAWELGAKEVSIRANVWLAAWEKAAGRPRSCGLAALAKRIDSQTAAVRRFMTHKYLDADVQTVGEDRYASLRRLLDLLA